MYVKPTKSAVETLIAAVEAGLDNEERLQRLFKEQEEVANYERGHRADEARSHERDMRDRTQRISQLGEEVAQLKEKVNTANATRDLVIEAMRRFTSLQITALGTKTEPHTYVTGDNTPHNLRKAV